VTAYIDDAAMVDAVSIRIDGATIYAQGVASEHTIDLLLGAVDYLIPAVGTVTLDLSLVTAVDAVAVRALFTARYDVLAAGATLDIVVPAHLQRRLTVCRPLSTSPSRYRTPRPPHPRR
jgi:hypothetical protein